MQAREQGSPAEPAVPTPPSFLEPPCWRSGSQGSPSPLLEPGGVCQRDPRACAVSCAPGQGSSACSIHLRQLLTLTLGSYSYFHFANSTCSSVCAENTRCALQQFVSVPVSFTGDTWGTWNTRERRALFMDCSGTDGLS